jgi:transposase
MATKERRQMSGKRYPLEFKLAAVRQITEGGYAVSDVEKRLDVTVDSLYALLKSRHPCVPLLCICV